MSAVIPGRDREAKIGDEVSESTCCLLLYSCRIERGYLNLFMCNCILPNLELTCSEL